MKLFNHSRSKHYITDERCLYDEKLLQSVCFIWSSWLAVGGWRLAVESWQLAVGG